MSPFSVMGKFLILVGVVLILLGLLLTFGGSIPFFKIGRLPGDIYIKKDNFTFYFPIATSIIISVLLSVVISLILLLMRK